MTTLLIVIASVLLIAVTTEVQLWCFTLNRHAWWLKLHPNKDRRRVNYKSLFYTSTFSALLSGLTLFTWMYVIVLGCTCPIATPLITSLWIIAMGSKLVLISFLSLLAKLCRLNSYYYPILTVWLCKYYKNWIS